MIEQKQEHDPLAKPARIVDHLVARIQNNDLTSGEVAELRRADSPETAFGGSFWKVAAVYLEPHGHLRDGDPARASLELHRWQVIVRTVAELHGSHQRNRRLGQALAAADVSERRLLRLLRADHQQLPDTLRAVSHQLASSGEPVDLGEIARLVLTDERGRGVEVRRRIARNYYGALYRQQTTETPSRA